MQIKDETLPKSRKQQREDAIHARKEKAAAETAASVGNKRKREEAEEVDPKLKEYLSVMQAPSKMKTWAVEGLADAPEEPPTKIQAIEAPRPGAESDDEYVVVPKKAKRRESTSKSRPPPEASVTTVPVQAQSPQVQSLNIDEPVNVVNPALIDDDDWLRSKTNRLLDLMDPEEIKAQAAKTAPIQDDDAMDIEQPSLATDAAENPASIVDNPGIAQELEEEMDLEESDPTLDAIRANGRLFVRNLPYSASEDDLREHFAKYGTIEEVIVPSPFIYSLAL